MFFEQMIPSNLLSGRIFKYSFLLKIVWNIYSIKVAKLFLKIFLLNSLFILEKNTHSLNVQDNLTFCKKKNHTLSVWTSFHIILEKIMFVKNVKKISWKTRIVLKSFQIVLRPQKNSSKIARNSYKIKNILKLFRQSLSKLKVSGTHHM